MLVDFTGTRWPSAVTEKQMSFVNHRWVEHLVFRAEGKPRQWHAVLPTGLWRSVSRYCQTDAGRRRLAQRHGVLDGTLNAYGDDGVFHDSVHDLNWSAYAKAFERIGADWSEPDDEDGTSYRSHGEGLALDLVEALGRDTERLLTVNFSQTGWTIRPRTLFAYLAFSAVNSWQHRTPMRICRTCHDWFLMHDRRQRHCSAACRVAAVRAKPDTAKTLED